MENASYFKEFLRDEVNLSDSSLAKLRGRVEAVYAALRADDTVGSIITGKIPQGSWAHRLIIKPKLNGEFDADFLLEMDEVDAWQPKAYINEVYYALDRHSIYSKQPHKRKCRCVCLEYAPEHGIGCHLDIVPFVTLTSERRVIVNRDDNVWEPENGSTDPQGFSDWVRRRDELTDKNFRKVVRLMKYLRDERGSFDGVKSVILTTVLGMQVTDVGAFNPERCKNIPTALIHIVEDLDGWLQARPTKPPLPNPNGDGTDFDHRWNQATYANFRDRIHKIAADMSAAYDEKDEAVSVKAWQALFGDKFRPPQSTPPKAKPVAPPVPAATPRTSRVGRAG